VVDARALYSDPRRVRGFIERMRYSRYEALWTTEPPRWAYVSSLRLAVAAFAIEPECSGVTEASRIVENAPCPLGSPVLTTVGTSHQPIHGEKADASEPFCVSSKDEVSIAIYLVIASDCAQTRTLLHAGAYRWGLLSRRHSGQIWFFPCFAPAVVLRLYVQHVDAALGCSISGHQPSS
jgi:hypothetical protein